MVDDPPEPTLRLDAFVPFRLSYTSNLVSDRIARTYEALFGLSIPEWRLVAVVAEGGSDGEGVTQAAIGARTRMDKVTVSRAAIALTARGLLARAGHPGDRRSHLLTLTEAGRTLYAAVAPKALELERRLLSALPRQEMEAFVATLRRIDAAALALDASSREEE